MNVKIIRYAIEAHNSVNHLYNGAPYSVHLAMVVSYAQKYINLIPGRGHVQQIVIDACWLNDTIEDCRKTYNDIKSVAGIEVADIVYAVSNEKGKSRSEKANAKYYAGIRDTQWARFVKLCDRLANVAYSWSTDSRMWTMYQAENKSFLESLFPDGEGINTYQKMIDELNVMLDDSKRIKPCPLSI